MTLMSHPSCRTLIFSAPIRPAEYGSAQGMANWRTIRMVRRASSLTDAAAPPRSTCSAFLSTRQESYGAQPAEAYIDGTMEHCGSWTRTTDYRAQTLLQLSSMAPGRCGSKRRSAAICGFPRQTWQIGRLILRPK